MYSIIRFMGVLSLSVPLGIAIPASADFGGPDGYVREGQKSEAPDPASYAVIEAKDGQIEQVDGETVVVVREPQPIAATEQAPPAPRTVVVEQPAVRCPGAIWVDGYWYYSNGQYVWVEG